MEVLPNDAFLTGYLISNGAALILLFFSVTRQRMARILFFLLFVFASCINWKMALQSPQDYINTADFALILYRPFITGWFSHHVLLVVGFIGTSQFLIGVSMLLKGWVYRTGMIGAIVFLLAIMPLGIAAAFPSTLIMAYGMVWLLKGKADYVWKNSSRDKGFSWKGMKHQSVHSSFKNNLN
jgi:hypothetical protein